MITGYVPGVWDMFHVGHLNVIRAARLHCDRLVVGVVTDEVVTRVKNKLPVVPFGERVDIVASIRFVDDVVADPHADKFEMWPLVGYDVLFKGDDWKGTEKGRLLEEKLATVGARMHYFPYTEHTSSTLLREVLLGMRQPGEPAAEPSA
jgi:glycerol-3-phosphate cytidylyltransferase